MFANGMKIIPQLCLLHVCQDNTEYTHGYPVEVVYYHACLILPMFGVRPCAVEFSAASRLSTIHCSLVQYYLFRSCTRSSLLIFLLPFYCLDFHVPR
jgi:hypothetical protein